MPDEEEGACEKKTKPGDIPELSDSTSKARYWNKVKLIGRVDM